MERNPLAIPEIIEVISNHLWRRDRVRCLRVSRLFYSVFLPRVWHKVVLEPPPSPLPFYRTTINVFLDQHQQALSYPTGDALQRHKHYIQELEFRGEYPSEYFSLHGCTHLHTINFSSWILAENLPGDKAVEILGPAVVGVSKLTAAHSETIRVVSMCLTKEPLLAVTQNVWNALINCSHLEQLTLKNLVVPDDCSDSFFKVCGMVTSLNLNSVKTPDVPKGEIDITQQIVAMDLGSSGTNNHHGTTRFILPGPRVITIVGQPYLRPITSATYRIDPKMVRACCNLESITWRQHAELGIDIDAWTDWDETSTGFCNDLSISPWPLSRLDTLDLSWTMVHDGALARILSLMHQLKTLKATRTGFGRLSLSQLLASRWNSTGEAAERLCDSIETLILDMCTNVQGDMIQTILASCSNLRVFFADMISIQDISQIDEWKCTMLTDLRFYLAVDLHSTLDQEGEGEDAPSSTEESLEMQHTAFARLGQLTKLRILNLTYRRRTTRRPMKTLDLQIESGLVLLSGLKDLRELLFQGDERQRLSVKEASWIVENWPRLRILRGSASKNTDELELMKRVFYPKRIRFHVFN
ncbi:hypothetical protein B0O80DRAFT_440878 [Mortierella sp. GBAus27b]|nr:hypothetical protein BGX31_007889 [Mortierella sp. GBA43]KAI8359703.1 hypothetical protein B0O80DRAFT_440878 [Mortierella sp. GBAus27b]